MQCLETSLRRSGRWRPAVLALVSAALVLGTLLLAPRPADAGCEPGASLCLLDRRYAPGESITELLQAPSNVHNRKILAGGVSDAHFGTVPQVPIAGYQWAGLQYRSGDAYVASGPRAEYQDVNRPYNVDRFYRAYIHVPRDYDLGSDGYSFRIVMQWHEGVGSPPFSLQLDAAAGTMKLVRKAYNSSTGAVTFPVVRSWPLSEWLGTTRLVVVQAKWLKNSNGYFRMWLDPDGSDYSAPDAAYAGQTIQQGSSTQPVYWKWGTYGKPSKYLYTGVAISEAGGLAGYQAVLPGAAQATAQAPASVSAPTVSGGTTLPSVLTATPGTWSGVPQPTLSYEWQRCDAAGASCLAIAGATNLSYELVEGDSGSTLRILVTASSTSGSAAAASQPTAVVIGGPPSNTAAPFLSGTPTVLQSLVTSDGTWTGTPTFKYQWRRCDAAGSGCVDIAGASSKAYELSAGDVGYTVRSVVVATTPGGSASAPSTATAVIAGLAPQSLTAPAISGSPSVGQALEGSVGTWSGIPTPGHTYQWRRCDAAGATCLDIAGATLATYALTDADAGRTFRVAVTASNSAGSTTSISLASGVVASPPAPFKRRAQGIASTKAVSTSLSIPNVSVKAGESLIVSVLARSSTGTIKSVKWGNQDVPIVGDVQSVSGIGDTPRFATFYLGSPAPRTAALVVTYTAAARAAVMSYEVVEGIGLVNRRSVSMGTGTAVSSGMTAATSPGHQYLYGVVGCACPADDAPVSLGGSIAQAGQRGGTIGAVPNALLQTGYGEQTASGMRSVTATFPVPRTWVAEVISFAAR